MWWTPRCAQECAGDRRGCLERLYPGIGAYIDDGTLNPAAITEWYTIDRARMMLGWERRRNFELPG